MSWKTRSQRIRQAVKVADILQQEGFDVRADSAQEQQFSCRLHGTGQDFKPSARYYPETNSWYCWGCQKARDPISTLRDTRGIAFREAVRILEQLAGLPPLPEETFEVEPELQISTERTLEQEFSRIDRFLQSLREGRDAGWGFLAKLWFVLDEARLLPEDQARQMLDKIQRTAIQEVKAQCSAASDTTWAQTPKGLPSLDPWRVGVSGWG